MIASVGFLTVLVTAALLLAAITPIVLLVLFVRDWRGGMQW